MDPNVLLVVLDSVRARNVGLYENYRETTPFLSEFASDCTVYEQARSAGSRSITGHASLFTGKEVEEHGLTSASRKLREGSTIFETLQDRGYDTAVFSENVWITDVDIGLRRGFDTVVGPQNVPFPEALDARRFVAESGRGEYREFLRACLSADNPLRSLVNGVTTKLSSDYPRLYPFENSPPGDVYLDRFLDWHSDRDDPWAACINLMDAHSPYEPLPEHNLWGDDELLSLQKRAPNDWEVLSEPESWWKKSALESLYDGTIHQLDSLMERLVRTLERRGDLDDTLLVITSDHGEGFGEPSRVRTDNRVIGHNTAIHEVVLHVPLVVRFPGQREPSRVSRLAATSRFPEVVMETLDGTATAQSFVTESAFATTYGLLVDEQLRSRAERYQDPDMLDGYNDRLRAVYLDDGEVIRKYLTWGERRAVTYQVTDSKTPQEQETSPEEVNRRFEVLDDTPIVEEGEGLETIDRSTKNRLENLGYI